MISCPSIMERCPMAKDVDAGKKNHCMYWIDLKLRLVNRYHFSLKRRDTFSLPGRGRLFTCLLQGRGRDRRTVSRHRICRLKLQLSTYMHAFFQLLLVVFACFSILRNASTNFRLTDKRSSKHPSLSFSKQISSAVSSGR